jgi:hypothetical protein
MLRVGGRRSRGWFRVIFALVEEVCRSGRGRQTAKGAVVTGGRGGDVKL